MRSIFKLSHNRKVLVKNFVFLSLLQIMRYFIPIIVLPYITRIIGVVHFGELAVASSTCMILQVIVDYGFNYIGAREVAVNKTNLPYLSFLYSTITIARCLIFLFCSAILMIITFFVPFLAEIRLLVFIALFPVLLSVFMPEWIYQGLEEMEFITYTHIVSRIIYVILIFTLIKQEEDYILYPIFNIVGLLFASVASLIILRRKNIRLHLVSIKSIKKLMNQAKDLFINDICGRLLSSFLNVFIGNFLSFRDAGIYSSASRLIVAAHHGQTMINRVFYPFLAQHLNKFYKYFMVNFLISLFIAVIGFVFSPFIYSVFYPSDFNDGIAVLRILTVGLLFTGISGSLSGNYLILHKKERVVRNISAFILFFGSVLFVLCIKLYGLSGAAYGSLTISIIRCLLLAYFCIRCIWSTEHRCNKSVQ
ncbi:MAG: oligosaccharide flippase family protein [Prevotella sp.]|nr:oligosaccharide flippase family protein [Prevotella sp.]